MFREVEAACERGCLGRSGVSKILCIRHCVSPSCYRDLYQADLVNENLLFLLPLGTHEILFLLVSVGGRGSRRKTKLL